MKKIIILKIVLFSSFFSLPAIFLAQSGVSYEDVKLEEAADFEASENIVSDAAVYILSNPANQSDMKRIQGIQLILAWMLDNPAYTFNLDSVDKLGKDIDARTAYVAAVAQYYLNNKEDAADPAKMKAGSWKIFLNYAENPDNKIKNTRKIKELVSAAKISDTALLEALK